MEEQVYSILSHLGSLFSGSVITMLINKYANRIQIIQCYYLDEDIMSKIPVSNPTGIIHSNIFTKKFEIVNTTNKDLSEFKLIFEFDASSKILSSIDISKTGSNKFKKKKLKENEVSFVIKNFNRKDKVSFVFEIADITDNHISVVEDNCIGIKVVLQDKRSAKVPSKLLLKEKN